MAVICKEAYFNSSTGEDKTRCLIWSDDELVPTGVIQISHGLWADVTLHKTIGRYLAACGFIVYAMDSLGHGKSGKKGDLPTDGDVYILNDVYTLFNIIKKRHPELPFFLLGEGAGCCVNRAFLNQFQVKGITGLIFCSMPYLTDKFLDAVEKYFDFAINTFNVPGDRKGSVHHVIAKALEFDENYDFRISEPILKFISLDKDYVKSRLDPSMWFPYTYRAWLYLTKIAQRCKEDYWIDDTYKGFPVLVLSGVHDTLGANGKFATDYSAKLANNDIDCKLILYPNNSHDLINSMDNDKALQDMLRWMFGAISK